MKRVDIKNNKIIELEKRINNNEENALNDFWKYINENGAPLIQDIENDKDNKLVTIIYREKNKLNNVVLIPPVGMRKLDECKMEKLNGTDLWYISYIVENDICFNYQFSINDPLDNDWERRWKNVIMDEFNKTGLHYIDNISKRERYIPFVVMEKAKKRKYIKKENAIKSGNLKEHIIYSNILNENRKITVYTPDGYNEECSPYGTVVLNDGFEYLNILSAADILDNLIYKKEISKVVVVFVESTKDRAVNLKCNDEYADFIGKEVMKFISDNYNISNDSKKTVIGGYSLGGLFASYMGLKYSNIFGNVLSQSGSYWYKKDEYKNTDKLWMSDQFEKISKLPLKFYINVGKTEPKVSMINTNLQFKNDLINMGYEVKFEEFCSGHDYWYWGETLGEGLVYLLGEK